MEQGNNIFQMEMSTEENIKMVDSMEQALMNGRQTILFMKEISKMVYDMEKGNGQQEKQNIMEGIFKD